MSLCCKEGTIYNCCISHIALFTLPHFIYTPTNTRTQRCGLRSENAEYDQ